MTYLAHRRTSIKADILELSKISASSISVGTTYSINTTPTKTTATVSGGYIVLHDQSNWRLEVCVTNSWFFSTFSSSNTFEVQWWDGTNYVGNRGEYSDISRATVCRNSATVFIPASSITTSISIIPRVSVLSGSIQDNTSFYSYTPNPSLRILELPT